MIDRDFADLVIHFRNDGIELAQPEGEICHGLAEQRELGCCCGAVGLDAEGNNWCRGETRVERHGQISQVH